MERRVNIGELFTITILLFVFFILYLDVCVMWEFIVCVSVGVYALTSFMWF